MWARLWCFGFLPYFVALRAHSPIDMCPKFCLQTFTNTRFLTSFLLCLLFFWSVSPSFFHFLWTLYVNEPFRVRCRCGIAKWILTRLHIQVARLQVISRIVDCQCFLACYFPASPYLLFCIFWILDSLSPRSHCSFRIFPPNFMRTYADVCPYISVLCLTKFYTLLFSSANSPIRCFSYRLSVCLSLAQYLILYSYVTEELKCFTLSFSLLQITCLFQESITDTDIYSHTNRFSSPIHLWFGWFALCVS